MNPAFQFWQSTIGKKVVVALTGLVWLGYLVAHMAGNLQIFLGPDVINEYSKFLHDSPGLLWGARVVLVAALVLHVVATVQLAQRNFAARPEAYGRRRDTATNWAARSMIFTGPLVLFFLAYHIAHLTLHWTPGYGLEPHHVYNNIVRGFQIPWLAGLYTVAMLFIGFHLYHGAWSFLQTLGVNHPRYNVHRRVIATVVTVIIVGGFLAVPLAVVGGLLQPDARTAAVESAH